MDKYIYDNNNGLWYELQGDYYIPCLTLPAEERAIGVFGQQHKRYLKEHKRAVYSVLLIIGKLNSYLADIDYQAQKWLETFVEQMKQAQDIIEQLKADDPIAWVRRINNIQECAMDMVNGEIIYA